MILGASPARPAEPSPPSVRPPHHVPPPPPLAAVALARPLAALALALLAAAAGAPRAAAGQEPVPAGPPPVPPAAAGTVAGRVRAGAAGAPLADVRLEVVGTGLAARTDAAGRFTLRAVPAGPRTLRVRHPGFLPAEVAVTVPSGATTAPVVVELEAGPVPLVAMVVTPGQYGVLRDGAAAAQSLSREQIAAAPQVGEDLFRIASRLPGVAASDYSAAFRVRGGAQEEVLVQLDGMELYEPFHLKDFDGALSIVDLAAVGGVELSTGGFGARHGNRLAGVLDVRSVVPEPDEGRRTELALTLTSLRATAHGTFAGGRGGWLWAARRGFLEHALRLAGEEDEVRPRYHDLFGKVTFAPSARHDATLLSDKRSRGAGKRRGPSAPRRRTSA